MVAVSLRVFLALCILICFDQVRALSQVDSEQTQEALSYLQGYAANWSGLENYDVVIDIESFRILDHERAEERSYRTRLVTDFTEDRFLSAEMTRVERNGGNDAFNGQGVSAFSMNAKKDEAYLRGEKAGTWRKVAAKLDTPEQVRKCLSAFGVIDVRLVGVLAFPCRYLHDVSIDGHFSREFNLTTNMSFRDLGDNDVEVVQDNFPSDQSIFRRLFVFDTTKIVPTKMSFYSGLRDRPQLTRSEEIEWKEFDGVFLPSRILGRTVSYRSREDLTRVPLYYEGNFRWNAVNSESELPMERDSISQSADLMEFLQLNEK